MWTLEETPSLFMGSHHFLHYKYQRRLWVSSASGSHIFTVLKNVSPVKGKRTLSPFRLKKNTGIGARGGSLNPLMGAELAIIGSDRTIKVDNTAPNLFVTRFSHFWQTKDMEIGNGI